MADIYLPNLNDSVMKKRSSLSHFNIPLVFERLIGSYNKFDYITEEDLTSPYTCSPISQGDDLDLFLPGCVYQKVKDIGLFSASSE